MKNPQASRTSCRFSFPLAGGDACGPAKPVPRYLTNLRARWRIAAAAVFASLLFVPAHAERLKELASIQGVRDNPLIGYGLMVGLDGTGDQTMQTPFTTCCSSWASRFRRA